MSIRVERYEAGFKTEWDQFVQAAKNGLFMYQRDYMDYHSDRFQDHSLLFFSEEKLVSVLPANSVAEKLVSHGGLTYGGLLLTREILLVQVVTIFEALLRYLKTNKFQTIIYKTVPVIFHTVPAQEDLYLLFRYKAALVKRDVNSVIDLSEKVIYTKGVKHNLNKAKKHGLVIKESADFETFMQIETEILQTRYETKPTHSAAEISLLAKRFPENIKLWLVFNGEECLGGSIVFYNKTVVHTQYAGFTKAGKELGAFAFLTDYLIKQNSGKKYYSFGISTTHHNDELNEGLVFSKESFMARTMVNDTYSLNLNTI